jgi:hypothetical protein
MAIVATLIKHHFAILFVVVTAGFIFGYGGILKPIFRFPIFRVMGRLTFAVYLVHMGCVRFHVTRNHFPLEESFNNLVILLGL